MSRMRMMLSSSTAEEKQLLAHVNPFSAVQAVGEIDSGKQRDIDA